MEMMAGMDFMVSSSTYACNSGIPQVVNLSGGADAGAQDSDVLARKVDALVWTYRQTWVVSAGNAGPGQTVRFPALAKNVITVGNVVDRDGPFDDTGRVYATGELYETSSQGPTKDDRLKPNVVATGTYVTSAQAETQKEYTGKLGTSMAAPHVSGIAATLMQHYPEFIGAPQLLRAHLMARRSCTILVAHFPTQISTRLASDTHTGSAGLQPISPTGSIRGRMAGSRNEPSSLSPTSRRVIST